MTPSDADYDFGACVAASYARPGIDVEDLKQIGRIAVWRASLQFDPSRGVRWRAWAHRWASMAAHSHARRPLHEVQFADSESFQSVDGCNNKAANWAGQAASMSRQDVQSSVLDLLLPSVREMELDARVVVLLLLCGCTARQIAIRLQWRYNDVLEVRRGALSELRKGIEAQGVTHV